jgi:uncharacterized protein
MKLHADKADRHTITAYGDGWIAVNGQRHTGNCLLCSATGVHPWSPAGFAELTPVHFENILGLPQAPELLIFGSGSRQRFAPPALLQSLLSRRIGVESMDTAAACRTYNILAAEGRMVAAALLLSD